MATRSLRRPMVTLTVAALVAVAADAASTVKSAAIATANTLNNVFIVVNF